MAWINNSNLFMISIYAAFDSDVLNQAYCMYHRKSLFLEKNHGIVASPTVTGFTT